MAEKIPPNTGQVEHQKTPLGPASLPYRGHWSFWPLIFVLNVASFCLWCVGYLIRAVAIWIWKNPSKTFRVVSTIFWRTAALASIAYLVADRIYETGATISSTGSDPKNQFYFPFAISNNSHIFTLRHIQWTCQVVSGKFGGITLSNVGFVFSGRANEIAPGDVLNVSCRRAIAGPPPTELVLAVSVKYDTNIFGYTFGREPKMLFTWAADATNPKWIRGKLAN